MSASTISMKHDLQEKKSSSKQKRFKVGKACFTCRVKKIKCDGLQPCMQCKARSRPCTFSKDGSVTETTNEQDAESLDTSPSPSTSRASTPPTTISHNSSKFKKPLPIDQKLLSSTTEILNRLTKLWPAEGKEGKWELDQTKLSLTATRLKPVLNDHTFGIEFLPSKSIQHAHIQAYFKNCYSVFPIIPKRIFFKQFDSPIQHYNASYLLSPILLLVVLAHGAQQNQDDECDTWFQHAKSLILQSKPKLSTVIALALMSQFQSTSNPYPSTYSAMAFQMCLDLNLMRNYTGELDMKNDMLYQDEMDGGSDLKELRKRVCWGCYTLDKIIHIQTGQPWMLRSKDIDLDMPLLQPDDDVTEHQILETFVSSIKLLLIAERTLQQQSSTHQPIVRTHTYDQMSLNSENELLDWLRSLPLHLQWTPVLNSNSNSLTTPTSPSNIMVFHLHLIYNIIELCVLKPYVSSTVKSIQTRSAAVATHLVRLSTTLIDNDFWYYNYDFTTYALIESIKFHLGHCSCENLVLARHARFMFQQSMPTMKKLLPMVKTTSTVEKITQFVVNLENAITEADGNAIANGVFDQDDIMTPFVLGSLNARYGDEERQQWSKLDYFANGLITPPTVKSKPSISMSSTMFAPPTMSSFHSYGANSHSAITDHLFQTATSQQHQQDWRATPDRFQYTKINNNNNNTNTNTNTNTNSNTNHPLEFLHNPHHDPQWLPATTSTTSTITATATTTTTKKSSASTADTNNSDLTDIDALVAQIQENNNSPNSHSSSNESSSSSTTAAVAVTMVTNENENLLYSLLSDRNTTPTVSAAVVASSTTPTRNQSYTSVVQPYMNVGLGIYASAHQHHNDVIRQHLPTSSKVVLTQHPQTQ